MSPLFAQALPFLALLAFGTSFILIARRVLGVPFDWKRLLIAIVVVWLVLGACGASLPRLGSFATRPPTLEQTLARELEGREFILLFVVLWVVVSCLTRWTDQSRSLEHATEMPLGRQVPGVKVAGADAILRCADALSEAVDVKILPYRMQEKGRQLVLESFTEIVEGGESEEAFLLVPVTTFLRTRRDPDSERSRLEPWNPFAVVVIAIYRTTGLEARFTPLSMDPFCRRVELALDAHAVRRRTTS